MKDFNAKERTLARENIVKVLYQQDLNQYSFSDILKTFVEKRSYDKSYFENIILLIGQNNEKIIDFIEKNTDLHIDKLIPIDRSILRLSVCEFIYRADVPKKVILNESIDIAKKYSTDESYRFINNILDQLLKCFDKND
ncbi:MAG: transcription antitermination factor NusB [Gammaproteobacteria bacterium]|jgi:transcription antitermination protein NusB|nr:transcription antitermination factor NusB [Gammaproteobacteria bacterium]MBT4461988.1 transcription antitermination factor NusB [Gammaproteobacteria bacterium]MBT4654500.1 transcription antitermination factor NusB [Gammaproteobacteria bacterium]MBT5761441.1 transcription antitermination factor NusB [Gammaproteobacteria bacterium]MBT6332004.1 transcription antitermination factor NusB [Gammaproteobacteria bacterium]